MAKLRPLPQTKVIRILESNGLKKVKSAKYITFKRRTQSGKVLTTWVPHHRVVTVFVLGYIIKQTEKTREEFGI